jgi:hypothetical protein
MQLLTVNRSTEHWNPNGGVRGRTEGAEAVCIPIGRPTISNNQTLQDSHGLNPQPKSTYRGIRGSSHICSRGLSYLASVGGEARGTVDAQYPNIRVARAMSWESVGGGAGSTLIEVRRREDGI